VREAASCRGPRCRGLEGRTRRRRKRRMKKKKKKKKKKRRWLGWCRSDPP
jgi:hypothetical protein